MTKHKDLKPVLKRNELAMALDKIGSFFYANKTLVLGVIVVFGLLGITLLGLQFYRLQLEKQFNQEWQLSSEGLLKEDNLSKLIQKYESIPAHQLARLDLAKYQLENQKTDEAIKTLSSGLTSQPADILTTIVVLKCSQIYASQQKYVEAIDFLTAHRHHILDTYKPFADLAKADLYLKIQDVAKARVLYTQLAESGNTDESNENGDTVVSKAKEKILQLEMK